MAKPPDAGGGFEGRPECGQTLLPVSSGAPIGDAVPGVRSPGCPRPHKAGRAEK